MNSNIFLNLEYNFSIIKLFLFIILIIWSLIWKGLALWKAARKGEKFWFIIFLVLNTVGIFEILYLYFLPEKNKDIIDTISNQSEK